jgi:hypothetical protein
VCWPPRPGRGFTLLWILAAALWPAGTAAQTNYYNTDRGRPITVEDAYATERYAFELQLAPLRFARGGGLSRWGVEPEIAYGILPRTHLELGVPVAWKSGGTRRAGGGIAGMELSLFHNLNTETTTVPAFGLVGELLLPVGAYGPQRAYPSATAIVTRTYPWARLHANAQVTLGPALEAGREALGPELSRWLAGLAVDRAFPLRAMLVTGDVVARRGMVRGGEVAWETSAGIRYQIDQVLSFDVGAGKRLTGDDRSWFVTAGLARAFGVRGLVRR